MDAFDSPFPTDPIGSTVGDIRIESLLGEGGMGEVYRGFDEQLERPVALKTIAAHRFGPVSEHRFLREARILSRLDHPNICRIYGLEESGTARYLVLELIDGKTLLDADVAAAEIDERLGVAEQIASALEAAHAEKIVHRDLKPDNVMVTVSGDVKVLDFGISRFGEVPESGAADGRGQSPEETNTVGDDRTSDGSVVGTLSYMSPEQASGQTVTPASDLWSFGLVLHELFTGERAIPCDLDPLTLHRRVTAGDLEPFRSDDADLAELVSALESVDPGGRPTATEALAWIRRLRDRPRAAAVRRRRWFAAAASVAVLGLAFVLGLRARTAEPLWMPEDPRRVVIMPVVNRSGDASLDWVESGLPALIADAARSHGLVVSTGETVTETLRSMGIDPMATLLPSEATRVLRAFGAGLVIDAELLLTGDTLEIRYRATGEDRHVVRSARAPGPTVAAMAVVAALVDHTGGPVEAIRLSADPFVEQAYAMGMHYLGRDGAKAALPFFEAARVVEPDFAWGLLRLAEVEEQLGDWERSAVLADEALGLVPDGTSDELRSRILVHKGGLAAAQSDYESADHWLEEALEIDRERGDPAGVGRSLFELGKMAYMRGEYSVATPRLEAALEVQRDSGDHQGAMDTLNHLGLVALNQGELDEAGRRFEAVEHEAELFEDRRRASMALVNLGNIAEKREEDAAAEELWRRALDGLRAAGDRRNELIVMNNLGVLALDRDLAEAAAIYSELTVLSAELGDTVAEAAASLNLALAYLGQHDVEAAWPPLENALSLDSWVRDHPLTRRTEGRLRHGRGEHQLAFAAFEAAKAVDPGWTDEDQAMLDTCRREASS